MCFKGAGQGAAGQRLEHRGFNFHKTLFDKKLSYIGHQPGTIAENLFDLLI